MFTEDFISRCCQDTPKDQRLQKLPQVARLFVRFMSKVIIERCPYEDARIMSPHFERLEQLIPGLLPGPLSVVTFLCSEGKELEQGGPDVEKEEKQDCDMNDDDWIVEHCAQSLTFLQQPLFFQSVFWNTYQKWRRDKHETMVRKDMTVSATVRLRLVKNIGNSSLSDEDRDAFQPGTQTLKEFSI